MIKTRKVILGTIFCAVMALCVCVGVTGFNKVETVHAETVAVTVTVKAKDEYRKETQLYYVEQTIVVLDNAFIDIQNQYDSWEKKYHDFRCEIDLKTTIGVDSVKYGDLPMLICINLHGHTLQLLHDGYWYIENDLEIYGGDGNGNKGNLTFVTTTEQQYSGSFWITGCNLEVHDTNVSGFNTNKRYPLFAMDSDSSNALFVNCSFENCHSTGYGGAIYMDQTNSLKFNSCSFENCRSYYGGAIYLEDLVQGGRGYCFDAKYTTFKNCWAYYGGAIYIEDNCAFDSSDGSAIMQKIMINFSSIKNCTAEYDGGGIYIDCERGYLDLDNSTISNCNAGRYGGGVFYSGYFSRVLYGEIASCKAKYGGGVYFEDKNPELSNVCIHDCSATKKGGGYYAEYPSSLFIVYCNFYNNSPSSENGTVMSEGTLAIIFGILAGVFLITAGVFAYLYFKREKVSEK